MARPDPERVWLGFAQSALGGLMTVDVVRDVERGQTWQEVNDALADDAAELADLMLDRWRMRYDDDAAPLTKRGVQPTETKNDAPEW